MNTLVPVQDDTLCVQLRDLVKPLGHIHHQQTYNKFKTFTKLITNSPKQNVLPFKSDIYTDSVTWRIVDTLGFTHHGNLKSRFETFVEKLSVEKKRFLQSYTYVNPKTFVVADSYMMDTNTAMAFAMWINPDKGCDFIQAVVNAQPEPVPVPYFHAKTCNKRMLAERYNRSISSVTTTFERNAKWLVEIGGMAEHVEERDGELWFTEAYASCIAFGGGKVAAQTKAKAMIASYDNQKIPSDHLQKLLS